MPVQLNHTIVHARDKAETARHLTEILGLPEPASYGPFLVVQVANEVSLDIADDHGAPHSQHYAFLVTEEEFDAIHGADRRARPGLVGRSLPPPAGRDQQRRRRPWPLLERPQRPQPGDPHRALRRVALGLSRGHTGRMAARKLPEGVVAVVADMQTRLDTLSPDSGLREFLATYQRTTAAVGKAILDGVFEDPDWVEEWDVSFARLYLDAFDAQVAGERCRAAAVAAGLRGAGRPAGAAPGAARHQRPRQLRPAAGAAGRHLRRGVRRPGRTRVPAAGPRGDRRRAVRPGGGRGRRAGARCRVAACSTGCSSPSTAGPPDAS